KPCVTLLALSIIIAGAGAAQENGKSDPPKAPGADEKVTTDAFFATEHVPADLKAGLKVDLKYVKSKTSKGAKAFYQFATLLTDLEVASVKRDEKPATPEMAVQVHFRVTKEQAVEIAKIKAKLITVVERVPGGGTATLQKPLPLHLDPSVPNKK